MLNWKGERVMTTPSVIYSPEVAIAGVDGGANGFIHIKYDGMETYGELGDKCTFVTSIYDSNGDLIHRDSDIHSPAVGVSTTLHALDACISFLTACAESRSEESENFDLYPRAAREWAEMVSDDLTLISMEIAEELGEDQS